MARRQPGPRADGGADRRHARCDQDGGNFYVQKVPEDAAGHALAVRAVAGVGEERGGEEAVAHGVAEAAAGYAGEGEGFGLGILGGGSGD